MIYLDEIKENNTHILDFLSLPIQTLIMQAAKHHTDNYNNDRTDVTLVILQSIVINLDDDPKSEPFIKSILSNLNEIMMAMTCTFYQQHMNNEKQLSNEAKLTPLCRRRKSHKQHILPPKP